jgi:hypothetical protein
LDRGLGTEALRLALGFAFATGLHRVSVRVLASNARAISCNRKCGFVEDGRELEAVSVEGGWQDDLIMGLLDVIGALHAPALGDRNAPKARRRDHLRVRVINADAAS